MARFELHVMDVSYFSGKLEAYLRYRRIAYDRVEVTWDSLASVVGKNTGLMQVPALFDRESGRWLRDSTSIIQYLDVEVTGRAVYCQQPSPHTVFLDSLLEDFADEWLWTPALYYRWAFKLDAGNLVRRFTFHDFLRESKVGGVPVPRSLLQLFVVDRQYNEYVKGAGVRDMEGAELMETTLHDTLSCLENHLQQHKFIGGARPCRADFGFMASMFRHFSLDPTPAKIMRQKAPSVYEWVARMWNSASLPDVMVTSPLPDAPPSTLDPLLAACVNVYLPYLLCNAKAVNSGDTEFTFAGLKKARPIPFRAWAGSKLVDAWLALDSDSLAALERRLGTELSRKIASFMAEKETIYRAASHWMAGHPQQPPFCPAISSPLPLYARLLGTPEHAVSLPRLTSNLALVLFTLFMLLCGAWWSSSVRNALAFMALGAVVYQTGRSALIG